MNELQIFNSPEFGEIRTIEENGKVMFCGSDVARALGYVKPQNAISTHCKGALKRGTLTERGMQQLLFILEGDLYRLIVNSKLPSAEKFERWIFDEVLPAIRKHGAYMTPEKLEEVILNPDTMIKLCTALKDEQDKRKALEAANAALIVDNAVMQPKADYFDELVDRNLLTNFRETAKQLGIKEKDFVRFLLDKKYIYRDKRGKIMPYAQYTESGLFEIKESFNEKTQWSGTQTLITPKGRETFRLLYLKTA
ncbi:phage antirepressor KilAC domain-containing protein [Hydrogeniiclostridium mannosilyticum]|uniref:phage antirepressor KilAC domain-containing protein n=1 Tax=Hydrogeniiclostridium mannosilyticum TaxID=2764322 RepID=UPI00174D6DFB|nr:phage antirepressor KilAC domain-containing protein [Hydrogeniiclostridium mannosilyticum]DAU40140.1 MAG TPA: repressor domain protein [Caudoviricetes sp.]